MDVPTTEVTIIECRGVCLSSNASVAIVPGFQIMNASQYSDFFEAITIIATIVAALGVVTNAINIKTFICMGVKDGVTASLLFLSVVDLTFVLTSLVGGIAGVFQILEEKYGYRFLIDPFAIIFFVGNVCLTLNFIVILSITFITVARCMCVTMPLHFKNTFNRNRCLVVLFFFFVFVWATQIPIFAHMGMKVTIDPRSNTTRYVMWMTSERERLKDIIRFILFNPVMFTCLVADMVCVIIITIKLRKSAAFRRSATAESRGKNDDKVSEKLSGKEAQVVLQVLIVCIILLACCIPKLIDYSFSLADERYEVGQPYHFLFLANAYLLNFVDTINSSVNFFVYLYFNSRFRLLVQSYWATELKK